MGKALSGWERTQRERERERARERAAAFRRQERANARWEREQERERAARKRQKERERVQRERELEKEAKETAKREQIEVYRSEAQISKAYVEQLGGFHRRPFSLSVFRKEFDARVKQSSFPHNKLQEGAFDEPAPNRKFELLPYVPPYIFESSPQADRARRVLWAGALMAVISMIAGVAWGKLERGAGAAIAAFAACLPFYLGYRSKMRAAFEAEQEVGMAEHKAAEAERRVKVDAEIAAELTKWNERRKNFEHREEVRKHLFDAWEAREQRELAEWERRRTDVLIRARSGEPNMIATVFEAMLPLQVPTSPPDWFDGVTADDYEVAYRIVDGKTVELVIIAPEYDIVPYRQAELNANGSKIKYKALGEKARTEIYNRLLASFSLMHAVRAFQVLPFLCKIKIECAVMEIEGATGNPVERIVLCTTYLAEVLDRIRLQDVDPIAVLTHFQHEHAPIGGKKRLAPSIDRDELTWASREDDPADVPAGLLPEPMKYERTKNPFSLPSASVVSGDGAVLYVSASRANAFQTIGDALRNAHPGAIVDVGPGTYRECIELDVPVTIRAESGTAIIDGGEEGPAVSLGEAPTAILRGLTLRNNWKDGVVANVESHGELLLENCLIEGCSDGARNLSTVGILSLYQCRITAERNAIECMGGVVIRDCEIIRGTHGLVVYGGAKVTIHTIKIQTCSTGVWVLPEGKICAFDVVIDKCEIPWRVDPGGNVMREVAVGGS